MKVFESQAVDSKTVSWKSDFWFLLVLLTALLVTFPEILTLQMSFVSGDHRSQHYPWAVFLNESLKSGHLPWWTNAFHCGFPILAEGQIGAFYPLNLLFHFFLPTLAAYNFGILAHYALGGFLFYVYLRSLRLSGMSSFFATLIYLFGTAQGGYYYNVTSQKVLIWLPLTFFLCDQIIEKKRRDRIFWLGAVFALELAAGYLQFAIYSIGFTIFYFFWFSVRSSAQGERIRVLVVNFFCLSLSLILAGLVLFPQLGSTLELAGFSNRFSYPEEFAYAGSTNPFFIATLFFPHWDGFLGNEIYLGAIGLFFAFVSLLTKKNQKELFFWFMALLALLLALGRLSPLYVLLVKGTGFYSFRIPGKFIFFLAVSLAGVTGFGFEKCLKIPLRRLKGGGVFRGFALVCFLGIAGFFAAAPVLRALETPLKEAGREYIRTHFIGSELHRQPLEKYFDNLDELYSRILFRVSFREPRNWIFSGFTLASLGLIAFVYFKDKNLNDWRVRLSLGLLLFFNLYAYGLTSIKGNYEHLEFVRRDSALLEELKKDSGIFRVHRAGQKMDDFFTLPLIGHTNMLHGLEVTGAYSPFVLKEYYDRFKKLGGVDDSQRLHVTTPQGLEEDKALLDLMNVKYVLSQERVDVPGLTELRKDENGFLYRNESFLPRAFFTVDASRLEPSGETKILTYGQQTVEIEVNAYTAGHLFLGDLFYPGWKAYLDGKEVPVLKAGGLFRAVEINSAGKHHVRFDFLPLWKKFSWVPFAGYFLCLFIPLITDRLCPKNS